MKKYVKIIQDRDPLILNETILGAFQGRTMPPNWLQALFMPIGMFMIKNYQVILTDQTIYFGRINLFGNKIKSITKYRYFDIVEMVKDKRKFHYHVELKTRDGEKIVFDANHVFLRKWEDYKFDEKIDQIFEEKLGAVQIR